MRWESAVSRHAALDAAIDEVVAALRGRFGRATPDLLVVFCSVHHGLGWSTLPSRLRAAFPGARVIGSSGSGVVGAGHELEQTFGLAVAAAVLPDTQLLPVRFPRALVGGMGPPDAEEVQEALGRPFDEAHGAGVLLFCDPFSCHAEALANALDEALPGSAIVGGLSSGGDDAGRNALFLDDSTYTDGAVAMVVWGNVTVEAVVAQGCKPVGDLHRVTEARGNLVRELDEEPALAAFEVAFNEMAPLDRRAFQRAPLVGVAVDPDAVGYRRGDFLVRQVVGIDTKRAAFAVGHEVQDGDVVQFHVRDARTSAEDIHDLLARQARSSGPGEAVLMFTCLGRGAGLYGRPDVDTQAVSEHLGVPVLAGFFCNGEIGPVRGRSFLHAYTTVVAVFRTPQWN